MRVSRATVSSTAVGGDRQSQRSDRPSRARYIALPRRVRKKSWSSVRHLSPRHPGSDADAVIQAWIGREVEERAGGGSAQP